ncbi:MAG: acyl-CoA synthetase [Thermodesulfobacteriota bacterium]
MSRKELISGLEDIKALETKPWEEISPANSTYELLASAAQKWPDNIAINFLPTGSPDEDSIEITYRQMFGRINQTANMFNDFGVGHTDTVSFLLPLLPQAHFTLWGAEAAGIVNPINFLFNASQIAGLLNAAKTKVLVALGPHPMLDIWQKVESIMDQVPTLEAIFVVGGPGDEKKGIYSFDETVAKYPGDKLTSKRVFSPDDIASYFHTGGTTGAPKLAMRSHQNEVFVSWVLGQMWDFEQGDALVAGLPLFHVAGAFACGLIPLYKGTQIVIPSPAGVRNPAVIENMWQLVEKYNITHTGGIPTNFVPLNKVPVGGCDISCLKYGVTGGAALPVQVEKEFCQRLNRNLLKVYGATEATLLLAVSPAGGEQKYGSTGIRAPYTQLKTVRIETVDTTVAECQPNEIGIVMLKGPNVFKGYLDSSRNKGVLTEEGWLNTGDLGYFDEDGYLFITGRHKDLIIRSGHNIDPSIIEEVAVQHPAVEMAAAVGRPDDYAGELPVLYVQMQSDSGTSIEQLQDYLAEHIAERPAVPKEIIVLDNLPMTAVGKIFKPELRWDIAQKQFARDLAFLNEKGLDVLVNVSESKSKGLLCKVSLEETVEKNKLNQSQIKEEIAAIIGRYQFVELEIAWL